MFAQREIQKGYLHIDDSGRIAFSKEEPNSPHALIQINFRTNEIIVTSGGR